ncbi:MAG TPA: hypothetical protein DCS07_13630 [Bdellovibrionales bacterium]|nr:MAG: hypothetical protein A2X97_13125 [Bdellovibrionales bacterium GWA1_52_35]OFZ42936.1 MAG: hypothetical protein A2070_10280 [Bdellovibrionales bacterium GWC1_52_8]HAR43649.1 hypothetical protein [Bdellovibrionales bacterium]HCM39968.1 hypothetical protein [Bdellovibrionales bacterium]
MNQTNAKIRILVVDDDDVTRRLLLEVLEKEGYSVQLAESGEEAIQVIQREVFSIVLSDIRMIELDGMAVLREIKKTGTGTLVILMTGFGSMEGAIEAIQEGAFDYVSKPFRIDSLRTVLSRAAKYWESLHQQKSQVFAVKTRIETDERAIIGKSPKIVEVYKMLARAAMSASNVLVAGEAGTGKELVARAIHENSARKNRDLVLVNCGSIGEPFLETEFFGNGKEKKGFLEEANGSSIFLDEVGELPLTFQTKLVRVLQEREVKPVGGREMRKIDVRVIAATHRELDQLVKAGKFREDLCYRLKVISIEMPPLRERMEDLPELVSFFLARYAEKDKKSVSHVSDEGMDLLMKYRWPGNIHELEHAIEHAVAMTRSSVLFPDDFPQEILGEMPPLFADSNLYFQSSLEDLEKSHILKVLKEVHYNKSRASEILGIDRATLYRKAQRYGIELREK